MLTFYEKYWLILNLVAATKQLGQGNKRLGK